MANEQEIIFLCGHRKGGTTLFSNMLDSHPEMLSYPTDLTVLYAYYPVYTGPEYSSDQRLARLDHILSHVWQESRRALDVEQSYSFDRLRKSFFDELNPEKLDDIGHVISVLERANRSAFVEAVDVIRKSVFKETSVEIYAAELFGHFPKAKFLQILRDPRDNYAALKSGVSTYYSKLDENENKTLASLLHRSLLGMKFAISNRARFGEEKYHALRFEDLTNTPKACMQDVCSFLGIDFDGCLLQPTIMGQATGGNSFDGKKFSDVSKANVGRWRDRISDFEASVIEFHFAGAMEVFGYEPVHSSQEQMDAASEFYKWSNYQYFFHDPFRS